MFTLRRLLLAEGCTTVYQFVLDYVNNKQSQIGDTGREWVQKGNYQTKRSAKPHVQLLSCPGSTLLAESTSRQTPMTS